MVISMQNGFWTPSQIDETERPEPADTWYWSWSFRNEQGRGQDSQVTSNETVDLQPCMRPIASVASSLPLSCLLSAQYEIVSHRVMVG